MISFKTTNGVSPLARTHTTTITNKFHSPLLVPFTAYPRGASPYSTLYAHSSSHSVRVQSRAPLYDAAAAATLAKAASSSSVVYVANCGLNPIPGT